MARLKSMRFLHFLGNCLSVLAACCAAWLPAAAAAAPEAFPLALEKTPTHLADYDAELRGADGRVAVDALVTRLKDLGVTTYYWLIWHAPSDWEDLQRFLPKAAEANIDVWVYLVPPSESPPQYGTQYSEPFRLDYHRWAEEIARLSLQHPNLTAWVIDDFYANHPLFSPAYLRQMQARAKRLNPRLAFLPLMYFNEITRKFAEDYREVIDGVVVAYPQDRNQIQYARAILNGETLTMPSELGCPWNMPSAAGDFAHAALSARVLSTNQCRLRFREQDDFTGPTAGYHFKQLLVDDAVVWERDVAGGTSAWQEVDLDVTPQTRGKITVKLVFRLCDKRGVSNFGVRWRLRDLRAEGLKPSAGLGRPQAWEASRRGPLEAGFGNALQASGPRFHIPFIVMTAANAGEFRMRHGDPASPERIAAWLRMCLQTWRDGLCDGVVTYCLDKALKSATFPLAQQLFKLELDWRPLPLITDGHIAEDWTHVGWGGFVVDGDSLRAECDPKGLGLLVYRKARFGNCQLRVVFKTKESKSNSGVIVRMADGILDQTNNPGATFDRDARGKISKPSMQGMIASAEREEGPWFAVHRGYEVQIMDANAPFHRTGAIYSLAPSSANPQKPPDEWKTMIITLAGNRILVDLDGQRVTTFDPASPQVPRTRQWFEPKREPKRPETGYIGLQNHDPGDVVWFREISVRPLPEAEAR